ncbi:unnamed protein product [Callosobruchus maculatus]|uniref:G-protein coupled receptors family 1 profile domain-containing protein n=1 Tax=Callosobruchus maculatus TaxID=64391 RepID=A0A653D396_CALMS|nr:unnamed protein product [Callosobruchus maculatus]
MTMTDINITIFRGNFTCFHTDEDYFPTTVQIIQTILFGVVCLVGVAGNTLVIYVVMRFSKMQTVTNMYLVNLAIADECFLIGIPFLITTIWYRYWVFGHFACKAYMISTSINQFTSSILLCIMSADRYIAVCHPISAPTWRTPLVSKIVSLLAWSFSILLIIPIIQHAKEIQVEDRRSCVIQWESFYNDSDNTDDDEAGIAPARMFTLYTFFCSFCIPLCLILAFYWMVIRKLRTVGPKNKSKERKKSHRKVTNLVTAVVVVYVICWLPYWITQFALNGSNDSFSISLHLLASCLSYSNSAINPILYAFLSDNFKKSFMKACTCVARKDINATLHLETSAFPKRIKAPDRSRQVRGATVRFEEEDMGAGPLVSRADVASTSAMSMTSRITHNTLWDSKDNVSKQQEHRF